MMKTLQTVGIEETNLNIIKAIYDQPTSNIALTREKLKAFPLQEQDKMSTLAICIWHSFGSPSYGNQRRKRNKRNPNWKEVKLSLFADDILYAENP